MAEAGRDRVGEAARPEGCLVAAVRVPARIVAVLVVTPLAFAWELLCALARPVGAALAATGRALGRAVRAVLYALVGWPLIRVYRYLIAPLGRVVVETGVRAAGLLAAVLSAFFRGLKKALEVAASALGTAIGWVLGLLVLVPLAVLLRRLRPAGRWVARFVLVPFGRLLTTAGQAVARALGQVLKVLLPTAVRWAGRAVRSAARLVRVVVLGLLEYLLVRPLRAMGWFVRRFVLVPLGIALVRLARGLWRFVLRPALLALGWLLERLVVRPLGWLWPAVVLAWRLGGRIWRFLVVRPCRWVRREVWWPVRAELRRARLAAVATVRETVRELRRALVR